MAWVVSESLVWLWRGAGQAGRSSFAFGIFVAADERRLELIFSTAKKQIAKFGSFSSAS